MKEMMHIIESSKETSDNHLTDEENKKSNSEAETSRKEMMQKIKKGISIILKVSALIVLCMEFIKRSGIKQTLKEPERVLETISTRLKAYKQRLEEIEKEINNAKSDEELNKIYDAKNDEIDHIIKTIEELRNHAMEIFHTCKFPAKKKQELAKDVFDAYNTDNDKAYNIKRQIANNKHKREA